VPTPSYTSEGFRTSKEPAGEDQAPNAKRQKVKTHIEFYFASDASAMVEHTKRVLHLEVGGCTSL
jgi:glucosamine--fructose-6-phosphate aminotransferase (isomerizing)